MHKSLSEQSFRWRGKNKLGHKVHGEQQAIHPHIVRLELTRQGIKVSSIRKVSKTSIKRNNPRIKGSEITLFTRQLATMLAAGMSVTDALAALHLGQSQHYFAQVIKDLHRAILEGNTLAYAFSTYPTLFNTLYIGLIRAGEQAGALDNMLLRLVQYREQAERLRSSIKKALFYPITVIAIALLISTGLLIFIVPQFSAIFASFHAQLPLATQWVIALSQFIGQYVWIILVSIALLIWGAQKLYRRSSHLAQHIDAIIIHIPIMGPIIQKASISRIMSTLAITFAAGMPIVDTLQTIIPTTHNHVFIKALTDLRQQLLTGQRIATAMQKHAIFSPLVIQMIAVGEESGTLETMLVKTAAYYHEEVDAAVSYLSILIEPVLMVILGIFIGGLIIAMYLPIFNMGGIIGAG